MLISDRGSCLTFPSFQEFRQQKGIQHTLNSTRHPQANVQVKHANRTILPIQSLSAEDQRHWDAKIDDIQRMLNMTVNKTITKSPFEAQPRFHGGPLLQMSKTKDEWVESEIQQSQIWATIQNQQEVMKLTTESTLTA